MKKSLLTKFINRSIYTALIMLLFLFAYTAAQAQDRDGSIDLTGSEGRYIYLNDDGSNSTLGIEGGPFTIEGWIYLIDNNNDNFNFFRLRSGDSRMSLRYNSDADKDGDAWRIDVKGTGYGETHWDLPYNKNGSNTGPDFMNNWRHIAFVSNGGSSVKLYIDGVQKFGYNLTSSGTSITDLWPSDNNKDGNSLMGYESVTGNNPGKMYMSEIRVWKTQLSSSEIAEYYDEEVNTSHPEWNNLIRYYQGHISSGSGSSRTFTDETGNYNAGVSNSDVTVNTSFTPNIKPGDFDNNTISTNFSANTCNTDDGIDVSWTDFQSTSAYRNGTIPNYEIRRVRDNKLIYTGGASSEEDTDVGRGDSESYQLKTYWYINDVIQYSDAVIYTGNGTMTEEFPAPSGFTATDNNCNAEIDLSWDAVSPSPPNWTIQRANNSGFTNGVTTLTTTPLDGTITSYTDTSPNVEQTYYYRIVASGNDDNGCSIIATNSVVISGEAYKPPTAPDDLTVVVDNANDEFDITWTNPSDGLADGFILRREKEDGSDVVEYVFNDTGTTSYSDASIDICQTYRYTIASTNECSPDGVFSGNTQSALLGQDLTNVIASLSASKGYYGNAVRLEWEINGGLSQVDRFMIERTIAGEDNYQFIGSVVDNLIFDDETAIAGTFYNYAVYGQSTCNDETSSSNIKTDLGFRQPFGIANGHIEYSGGNAVADVSVNFERQDGLSIGKSLKFDGDGDYIAIDGFSYEGTDYTEMTVETWFKTTTTAHDVLASADASEYWRFYISGGNVGIVVQGGSNITSVEDYNDGEWHHAAAVFEGDSLKLYIDGALNNATATGSPTFGTGSTRFLYLGLGSEASSFNAGKGPYDYFEGNLDEFRIWSVARSAEEIARNYNRLISNEQTGLEVYYRMDEGTGDQVFDASKDGEIFNKHDGTFGGGVSFSDDIPSADKLGIKGITDEFGDYTADYIPYNGSGDVFRVTPAFGQHQFEPATKSIYLGDGAAVQNDLNFIDISSFTVTGKVTYENSEVPVEGVAIYIDGLQAVDANNQAVRTDINGNYEIDVPIGNHYLSAYKEKHTFSEGVFPPLNDFGDIETHEFTEDLTVNFTDDTKIKVAGRIVGGNIQAALPLGFDKSLNNVGVSRIEMQLLSGYDLDVTDGDIHDILIVTTDPYSGEYEIEVIPEKWIINEAGNETYFIDPADISLMDFSSSLDTLTTTDTTYNFDDSYDVAEYHYNHDMSFIIQSDPIIEVLDGNNELFHGEDSITFTDQETEAEVTLQLGDENPFAFDVFKMGADYDVNIYVYEVYENPNHPDYVSEGGLVDKVPVKDAEIIINDNLMINPEPTEGTTNAEGLLQYEFRAGTPSLAQDGENTYTKTFEVEATVNGLGITWNQGDVYRAYVLGALPLEGTDFITYGPDQVDIVLRDPPGTNSYAWIEEGSAFSAAETWQFNKASSQGLDVDMYSGVLVQAGGGLAGPVVKNETVSHSEIGLEVDRYIDYDGTFGRRVTFKERIETSSDPEDVGSMADLYIGRSFNAFMQETKNLKIMPKDYVIENGLNYYGDGDYVLGEISGFTMDEGDTETYFVYSQRHILTELIPTLIMLRGNLMTSAKYESLLDVTHPCYGMSNDSQCLTEHFTQAEIDFEDRSYRYVGPDDEMDSVDFVNDNITSWLNAIALNEAEKAEAITQNNLSIDGSTGAYTSTLTEEYSGEYNWNSSREMNFKWNGAFSNQTNNAGIGLNTTMNIDLNFGNGEEHTQERSLEFGYVIDERDEGDYYSIDIKKQQGIGIFDASDFVDNIPSKDEFIVDQLTSTGIAAGISAGVLYVNSAVIGNGIGNLLGKSANANVWVASLQFGTNLSLWTYEMVDVAINATETIDAANGARKTGISGFSIGSPIFSIRGGQTKCPYEPAEFTNFYINDSGDLSQLHTATLAREAPTIASAPTIQSNIPDSEVATFTISLGNESEAGSDNWYELSIDESTNPDGAIILIDGVSAEREFLVPANQIVTKTLTVAPGSNGTLDYENLGIVLHSSCQNDPTSTVAVIADTVYITAKFLPTCTNVEIANMNDNWIINYADGDDVPVTLGGYDINATTLESVSFQYKTLSGNPITVMTYFKDVTSDAYINYDGAKDVLSGGDVSFSWDISSLTDGDYQLIGKTTCIDGSVTESEILTGVIDRVTPVVFGTEEPTDGIYDAGDDIKVKFNEELASGLVRDNNITLMSILNGADVSHATAVEFDGVEDEVAIDFVSMNSKSFTIEFWMQNEFELAESQETIISHGTGNSLVEIARFGTNINFTLGQTAFLVDPSPAFTSVNPWDSWHHWAFIYNQESQSMTVYADDQVLGSLTNVAFDPAFSGTLKLAANSNYQGRIHELRIWEDVRSFGEVIANMSVTLSGNEPGLYGYWPMDEGTGNLAVDRTSGRNATINADWSLEPGGYSWEFDGSNHLAFDGRNIVIDDETDMTMEFWFKMQATGDTVTLFSNGKGDATDVYGDSESIMAVIADENGIINILSNGYTFQGTNDSYADNNWHHFALVVDRRTNAKVYIDGALENQELASNISGLSGAEMFLGARGTALDPVNNSFDKYLNGHIDEFRVWNTARSATLIESYKHSKVAGDEPGLVTYIAFETYEDVQGAYIMQSSLADLATDEDLTDVNDAVSSDGLEYYSDQKPAVKDIRGLQSIPFDYVVNDDEIIIIPNVDLNRIEGQILEISVKNVLDLNGNRQLSPVTWTAFVQQNQVKWVEDQLTIEKHVSDAMSFTASFTNESGTAYDFELENVPVWLKADMASGVVNPQETITISFEVNKAVNIGSYENGINLTTESGFNEKLTVSLRVYGDEPDWSLNTNDYQYSMAVFGRLIIEDEISTDPYDRVAAFVGDELRGVANLEYVTEIDAYEAFLTIYSNETSGETITLKAYDASTGRIHENVTPALAFMTNDVQGSILNPLDLVASDEISMEYHFEEGWNWISFNLNDPDMAVVNDLFAGIGSDGDIVKNQSQFDIYDGASGWFGTITLNPSNPTEGGFKHGDMYKLYLTEAASITMVGSPVTVVGNTIDLKSGWNHVGFLPQFSMTLEDALVSMNPQDGDLIKTEDFFAMYSSSVGWVGSLSEMEPGKGYMMYSGADATLEFPIKGSLASRPARNEQEKDLSNYPDLTAGKDGHNMSVIATPADWSTLALSEEVLVVAFAGDQVRGIAERTTVGNQEIYFLSVSANVEEEISFKVLDLESGTYHPLVETFSYKADDVKGTLSAPFTLSVEAELSELIPLRVSPNPFNETLMINMSVKNSGNVDVRLIDLNGKEIMHKQQFTEDRGNVVIQLTDEVSGLKSGLYLLLIEADGTIKRAKVKKD